MEADYLAVATPEGKSRKEKRKRSYALKSEQNEVLHCVLEKRMDDGTDSSLCFSEFSAYFSVLLLPSQKCKLSLPRA